jgi:hypothetical protein
VDDEHRPGLSWIDLVLVVGISGMCALVSFEPWVHAHHCSNETAAVGALKTITTSQSVFREDDKEKDGNLDYGMLSELSNAGLVDSVLGKGSKQGYSFQASYSFTTSEFLWFAVANPQVPTSSGDRYFETNVAGVIFYTTAAALLLDTSSCTLPAGGVTQVGK